MEYNLKEHKKFKVGDKVIIYRSAEHNENGWNLCWVETMFKLINKSGIIVEDCDIDGFRIKIENEQYMWFIPYFCLRDIRLEKLKNIL